MQTRQKSIQMCQANTISLKIPFKVQKPVQAQSYQYKIIKSHSNMSSQYILIQKSVQAWINRSNPIQICQINTSSFQNAFKVQNSVQSPKFRSKSKIPFKAQNPFMLLTNPYEFHKTHQKCVQGLPKSIQPRSQAVQKIKGSKTTAPRIPAWSPTVVLTGRHSG